MKFFIFPFAIYNVGNLENITYEPDEGMIHFVFKSSKRYAKTEYGHQFLEKIESFLRSTDSFLDIYEISKKIDQQEDTFSHFTP